MSRIFLATRSGSVGRKLRMAMSASRRRRSLWRDEVTISTEMAGWRPRSFARIGGRRKAAWISLAAMTHLGAAMPNLSYALDTHYPWQWEDIIVGGRMEIEGGCL